MVDTVHPTLLVAVTFIFGQFLTALRFVFLGTEMVFVVKIFVTEMVLLAEGSDRGTFNHTRAR